MENLYVFGTGNAQATHCYNTCFALRDGDEYFMVDAGGGNGILRILEDMEHLGPRRAGRIGNNQLLQALPVDTAGRYGDPLPGDRRVFAQPSAEDGGPLLGQPFAGCRRAVGTGAAPQQNPQFGHLGEFVRARESFGPGFEDPAVVADRRIDHGAALPEIDVVRIGLRLRFRTREKSQGAHQGAHPYLVQ